MPKPSSTVHVYIQHVCESVWGAGIPSSNWAQPFNVSQGLLVRVLYDASKRPSPPLSFFMSSLCTLLHSPFIESVIRNMSIYIQAILPASCFTVHSIASLVVDIISASLFSSDWHIVGLMLPSVCETWWGVCLFHLYFIERNIFSVLSRLAEASTAQRVWTATFTLQHQTGLLDLSSMSNFKCWFPRINRAFFVT